MRRLPPHLVESFNSLKPAAFTVSFSGLNDLRSNPFILAERLPADEQLFSGAPVALLNCDRIHTMFEVSYG